MVSPPPIALATLGMWDTMLLMVLALVVFGPRRLPMIGRQLGKLMYEFRKASNDFKFQMEEELRNAEEADRRKKEEERQRALAAGSPQPQLEEVVSPTAESPVSALESSTTAPSTPPSRHPRDPVSRGFAEAASPEEPAPVSSQPTSPTEEASPRIQPPSTGETVAAEPPGKVPESVISEAVRSEPEVERSEPAAHHG